MEITDINLQGCRQLIVAIIHNAILESKFYKRPTPPQLRIHRQRKVKSAAILMAEMFLVKWYNCHLILPLFYDMNIVLFDHMRRKIETENEKLAWEARQYMKAHNKAFKIHCDILDIDPVRFEKKFELYIREFDHGLPCCYL
jgi:hypothetical protein